MLKSERVHFPNQSACDSTTVCYHPQSALCVLGAGLHAGSPERTHSFPYVMAIFWIREKQTLLKGLVSVLF